MKKNAAFSLIELLIVIAIIGILAGLISTALGGLRASAQEQHCRNNLKQLHDAVVSHHMTHGKLPHAMAYDTWVFAGIEWENGWVSVYPNDGKIMTLKRAMIKGKVTSVQEQFSNDLGTGEPAKFGIENGSLWDFTGDLAAYVCPAMQSHVRERARRAGSADPDDEDADTSLKIYRTYAMNAYFGCADSDYSRAIQSFSTTRFGWDYLGQDTGRETRYQLTADKSSPYHIPKPERLLLFTEVVPAYENGKTVKRASSGSSSNFKNVPIRGGAASADCCINPATIDDKDERIGMDINFPSGKYPASEQGYKYGIHPTGVKKPLKAAGGKSVEIMGSLAVFCDGHIEKVFANTDGEENGKNTAWYYNRGYEPSNTMPKGTN